MCIVAKDEPNIVTIKPKIAQSIIFDNNQDFACSHKVFVNEPNFSNSTEENMKEREADPSNFHFERDSSQLFLGLNEPWFNGRKIIETESLSCDDESVGEDNPDFWLDCKFIACNKEQTRTYVFDCNEKHKMMDLIGKLARV